jgi:transposase
MVASYSLDLRKRILKACDKGGKTKAVAERFEVSESFVRALKRRRRVTGKMEALPKNSGPKPKLKAYENKLRALIKAQSDATLEELRERLGVDVQLSTLWYTIDRLGLSVKKNRARQRATARRRANRKARMERKPTRS